jgi:hypothetical protein
VATLIGPFTVPETAAALEGAPATRQVALALGSDAFFYGAVVGAGRAALALRCASLASEKQRELISSIATVNALAHEVLGGPEPILRLAATDGALAQVAILFHQGKLGFTPLDGGWFLISADPQATFTDAVAAPLNALSDDARLVAERIAPDETQGVAWANGRARWRPSPAAEWQGKRPMSKRDFLEGLKEWHWP